ncbi:MAG: TIM barrel protein [Oscillospiraceae bacterium]|nr:TIM barrel protein [Oscillospiraceae bacterium]
MPRIGFSLQNEYPVPVSEILPLLKKHGFDTVSPVWSPELDLTALSASAKALSLKIQSVHAPHKGVYSLWSELNGQSRGVFENIFRSIDDCARFEVPILVMHGWNGFDYNFNEDELNFCNFDKIVHHAELRGVAIAFENLEGEEFLNALMKRYLGCRYVGYCWDSGHEHCYPHRLDFLNCFGDRLIMMHLNDNFGTRSPEGIPTGNDDLHLLPYDGTIDWEMALKKLCAARRQDILNFELKKVSTSKAPQDLIYEKLSVEAFIAEAGKRARRIAEVYDMLYDAKASASANK